jgi:putative ABC transport system permease protein
MVHRLKSLVQNVLRWKRSEALLDEELQASVEILTNEKAEQGADPREARRQALVEIGGVEQIKEEVRGAVTGKWLHGFGRDTVYVLRRLRRSPGFTLVAAITLALGIGANTAIFSVVSGVLLEPIPLPDAEELVVINETNLPQFSSFSVAPGNFVSWQERTTTFERMAAWTTSGRFILTGDGEPESLAGARVTQGFLSTLGVSPILGRDFATGEDTDGENRLVLLSHRLWQQRFGAEPDVIGQSLILNGAPHTIVGVMDPGFGFPSDETEIWVPYGFNAENRQAHGSHGMGAIGRLKDGVDIERARDDLAGIARQLEAEFPNSNEGWGVLLRPLMDAIVGEVRPTLIVLWGAVGFVLLIACANVANLLLASSTVRRSEIAVRLSMGASRWTVARQLLTESGALALIGGALGLGLAVGGIDVLRAVAPDVLPRMEAIRVDVTVFVFTLVLSLATGLVFGLVPALQASGLDLNRALKHGGRGAVGAPVHQRFRNSLVVAQVTLGLVLLVGAGLTIRSLERLSRVEPGFNPDDALVVSLQLPSTSGPAREFARRAVAELAGLPAVDAVGVSHVLSMVGDYVLGVHFENREVSRPGDVPSVNYYSVTPGYFDSMQIPLLRGRVFTETDNETAARVAVVSESFARRFYPDEDPIGQRIHVTQGDLVWREIVGVVGDVHQYGLAAEVSAQVYEPFDHLPFSFMSFVVRSPNPEALAPAIRERIRTIDPNQPVSRIVPYTTVTRASIGGQRFLALLLGTFGALALTLAAVGIYGVMAYSVSQRTHEIGLRMALGADRSGVLRLVVLGGMRLSAFGIVLGLAVAVVLSRVLAGAMAELLFETSTLDLLTFVTMPLALGAAALIACYLPARRATRVDPMVALRWE